MSAPTVHGSHIAEMGRQATLSYRGTPHPLARARHAAPPRIVPAVKALTGELVDASRRNLVTPLLTGLLLGGLLLFGLHVLLRIAGY